MSKSFEPLFNLGRRFDSGSFAREFLSYFDEITVIGTSDIDCRCACSSDILARAAVAARLKASHSPGVFLMWKG